MRLIKSVEIGYFRSVYKESLHNISDLTVLFGRNDSGKSNFLRALNLFFNDCTNPGKCFDFGLDFNHSRLHECTEGSDTRKFVYIKVFFDTPDNWVRSLGDSFWVKKTWSVSRGDEYIFDSSIKGKNQQFLTRFLNKVRFHYIPAIKDRGIFENLLGQVYEVISGDESFYTSLSYFTKELQRKTDDISQRLLSGLSLKSVIAPPDDLTELFKSLDFETKNNHEDPYSLTLQKGDGVQVRHIPVILSFLSDKSKEDYHVWGFEEPENSLELASACEEAGAFLEFSKDSNKQIFLTSHSPAFFSLEDEIVKRYFVSKKVQGSRVKETSVVEEISPGKEPADLMNETPLLPAISAYLRAQSDKLAKAEEEAELLREEIDKNASPIVFVEGESDRIVFERAWELFGNGEDLRVLSCRGTSRMKSLSQKGDVLELLNSSAKVFVLIDNDKEGRDLSKFAGKRFRDGGVWVNHNDNGSCWCRLPFSEDFKSKMNHLKIPKVSWPFVLENCFSSVVHKEAISDGGLRFDTMPHQELLDCDQSKRVAVQYAASEEYTYLRAADKDYKVSFAEWVVKKSESDESFMYLFKGVVDGLVDRLS